ncbi:MAG: nitrate reductase [Planctomycetota bacterium]
MTRRPAVTVGRAVCPYCGVGCVLDATVENNRVTRITVDPAAEPNLGMMCPKGALVKRIFDDPDRLEQPMIRRRRGGPLTEVAWDEAIDFVAKGLTRAIYTRGPDAVGWYGSGQLDTEASYVFTKLFKGFIGSNHTDTNSRLCMSSAVAGYQLAFGSDGPPTCYDDIEQADTFFIVGANMATNHPVLFNRIRRRRTDHPDARIVVVDPRRTKTAEHADLHLPVALGADVALMTWLARRTLDTGGANNAYVADHTRGWDPYVASLRERNPEELARLTGLADEDLEALAELVAADRRVLTLYCMGTNQSSRGTDKNTAIINWHLMTGQVGKPGCGPFSLTGQPNAMGGREVGYLAHQLPGYRRVDRDADRAEIERAWQIAPGSIDAQPGMSAVPMFDAAARGEFDALWIACTNPVVSMPNAGVVKRALERTPLVIVQDITQRSESTDYADVVLPAAQWAEKSGTMTNSERLVVRSERFLDPPGEARPDWQIPAAVARAMGFSGFDYGSAEEVWDEFRRTTAGRPCDMTGLTNHRLADAPGHWPAPAIGRAGHRRRYADGRFHHPDGHARFVVSRLDSPQDRPDAEFPLWLTTGRVAAHWHTRTKTGLAPELSRQDPEPFIELHPDDADDHHLEQGQRCRIVGRRGEAQAVVRRRDTIRRGVAFATFHFGDRFAKDSNINTLTSPAIDPVSKQPELKACAIRLERVLDPKDDA